MKTFYFKLIVGLFNESIVVKVTAMNQQKAIEVILQNYHNTLQSITETSEEVTDNQFVQNDLEALVFQMRNWQKAFFASPQGSLERQTALKQSKHFESLVDKIFEQ